MRKFYAHSLEGKPPDEWHLLEEHLSKVAELAGSFADVFSAKDWAYPAGVWHVLRSRFVGNVGKCSFIIFKGVYG